MMKRSSSETISWGVMEDMEFWALGKG
jgi:hypothetical protein